MDPLHSPVVAVTHVTRLFCDINGLVHGARNCRRMKTFGTDKDVLLTKGLIFPLLRNLAGQHSEILCMDVSHFYEEFFSVMLFGSSELLHIVRRIILAATLEYIKSL